MSDNAAYVETTRVGHSDIPFTQLLELVVAVAGLDLSRIRTILAAGTATNGGRRYRWQPMEAGNDDLAPLLERFPKPDPARRFDASRCLLARIRAGVETIELPRETASARRLGQQQDFWAVLIAMVAAHEPRYETFSYRDGADLYIVDLQPQEERGLREAAGLLTIARTAEQVARLPLERVTLYVKR